MSRRRWACRSSELIVATNVNDILHRALSAGDYSVGTVTPTAAPSMDIQVSSNFERLLFDLHGRDGAALAAAMQGFEATSMLAMPPAQRDAGRAAVRQRADRSRRDGAGDALGAARLRAGHRSAHRDRARRRARGRPAERHAGRDAGDRASGQVPRCGRTRHRPAPDLPARIAGLFEREERYDTLPADLGAIEAYIAERAVATA